MGYSHFLLRDDFTLFDLGKHVNSWANYLGASSHVARLGAPIVMLPEHEETLAECLEAQMREDGWHLDQSGAVRDDFNVEIYAQNVARRIVAWCDGHPFRFVGEDEAFDELDHDPNRHDNHRDHVTGSRFEDPT